MMTMRTVALTKESTKDILENLLKRSPNNYGKFESAVDEILKNVKEKGDEALFAYTKEFDSILINGTCHQRITGIHIFVDINLFFCHFLIHFCHFPVTD